MKTAAFGLVVGALNVLTVSAQPDNWYKQRNFYQSVESRIITQNPQSKQPEIAFQFTPEYEMQLGAQSYQALLTQAPVLQDADIQDYLQRLVGKIVNTTPGPPFTYKLTVLHAPGVVNAVTPPGFVVIYSGLLLKTESEGMLAATIAHELAHNYGHHVARRMVKAYQAQMIANAALAAAQSKGAVTQTLTNIAASFGMNLFLNAYSRFEEKEADLYGVHLLYNSGYNPTWMAEMFLRMYQDNPQQPAKFLSTHPPLPDRARYISEYLEKFRLNTEMQVDSAGFQKLRAKLGLAPTPMASVAPEYKPVAGVPALQAGSGAPSSPAPLPRTPPPGQERDSRGSLQIPQGTTQPAPSPPPPPPPAPPAPTGNQNGPVILGGTPTPPPSSERQTSSDGPVILGGTPTPPAPPAQEAPAPTTPSVPKPALPSTPQQPGAENGVILWSGRLDKGETLTLTGPTVTQGTLNGWLPGAPVLIDVDAREFAVAEAPAPSNGWNKIVIRSKNRRHTVISIQWRLIR